MKGGLIDVDNLLISLLQDHRAKSLDELQLFFLEISVLGLALPVSIVGSLELHSVPEVVRSEGRRPKGAEVELLLDNLAPLHEIEMSHAVQSFAVNQP